VLLDLGQEFGRVVYNGLTGSLFAIRQEVATAIEEDRIASLNLPEQTTLYQAGVVDFDAARSRQSAITRYREMKASPAEGRYVIHPTNACNLACEYCYERKQDLDKGLMPADVASKVVGFIAQDMARPERKRGVLKFYGGEPLLATDRLREIAIGAVARVRALGKELRIWVKTNGTLIDDTTFAPPLPRVDAVEVTIDGGREEHNMVRVGAPGKATYDRIMNSLAILKTLRVPVLLRINASGPAMLLRALRELDIEGAFRDGQLAFYEGQVSDTFHEDTCGYECKGRMEKVAMIDQVLAMRQAIRTSPWVSHWISFPIFSGRCGICPFARPGAYIIDPRGDLYACTFQAGNPDFRIGSLRAQGKPEYCDRYTELLDRSPFKDKECSACPLLPTCWGGCFAKARIQKGSFTAHFCGNTPALMRDLVKAHFLDIGLSGSRDTPCSCQSIPESRRTTA
jgi:uncharacterized protein